MLLLELVDCWQEFVLSIEALLFWVETADWWLDAAAESLLVGLCK
jgi:hypothetical protein